MNLEPFLFSSAEVAREYTLRHLDACRADAIQTYYECPHDVCLGDGFECAECDEILVIWCDDPCEHYWELLRTAEQEVQRLRAQREEAA